MAQEMEPAGLAAVPAAGLRVRGRGERPTGPAHGWGRRPVRELCADRRPASILLRLRHGM